MPEEVAPLDSRQAAERAAKLLGCEGAHKWNDGWHPCESHEAMQTLLNEGIAAYRELSDRRKKQEGKAFRTITWEELLKELQSRSKKRRKRFTRWEHLREREPGIESGPPGLTSAAPLGKGDKNPHENHTGIVAVLLPSEESATPYLQKGGLPLEELHLTLGYFGSVEAARSISTMQLKESLVKWAWSQSATCSPISAEVGGVARIGNDSPQAVVLLVEDPKLLRLRKSLDQGVRQMALDRTHPGFLPHMTLGYGLNLDIKPGDPVIYDHIAIWWGEERIKLPLIGRPS